MINEMEDWATREVMEMTRRRSGQILAMDVEMSLRDAYEVGFSAGFEKAQAMARTGISVSTIGFGRQPTDKPVPYGAFAMVNGQVVIGAAPQPSPFTLSYPVHPPVVQS
ncbi:MAG: hypothetical protein ACAH27_05855 [Xanthobacteraceae bacterium]